jgi:hypothetical protein
MRLIPISNAAYTQSFIMSRKTATLDNDTQKSTLLDRSNQWDNICFPVESVPATSILLPGFEVLATDRARAIVGTMGDNTKQIFAFQSSEYSLIPNALLREVAERCLPNHKLDARYNDRGEYTLNLILPDEINITSGSGNKQVKDRLFKSLMMNNSYSGKTPFSLQGTAMKEHTITETGKKMRVSYYREVCTNGMMGWADDFMTLDEYLDWLVAGQPTKHKRVEKVKPAELVDYSNTSTEREIEVLVKRQYAHKGLDLELFKKQLCQVFTAFSQQAHSLNQATTVGVFQQLAQAPTPDKLATVLEQIKLPKALAKAAMERMAYEEKLLGSTPNLWLAYNAVNFALFNAETSLSISQRFALDEAAFHKMAELAIH